MAKKKVVDVNIFRAGTQTSAQGVVRDFSQSDLQQVADSYDPSVHEAPILIGHEMSDKVPSWGWVKGMKVKGNDLVAQVEFSPQMGDYIRDGLYKKVSASFYSPESKINPEPGKWSLRHVAMLGGQPPAVKGLKGFAYSEESAEEGVFDFAMKLTPEAVFDDEHGPTLKTEQAPLEQLKEKLEEARTEMAKADKEQAEQQAQAEIQQPAADAEFAEKKMKKAPAGEQGAEDAEEEVSEDEMDSVDSKEKCGSYEESDAKKDRKMAAKDVKEAKYDKARGKKKRAGELMADADQDNEDADVDDEDGYAEGATAERQGKVVRIGAPKHNTGMPKLEVEESEGAGPEVSNGKPKKEIAQGEAMEDPNKGEYRSEQEEQYEEGRAYKDVAQGEALQDKQKGKYRKQQNEQYEEAQHGEPEVEAKIRKVKKDLTEGEAMEDPRKGDYRPDQEEQYEEGRAKNYKHGDAMQDDNEGKLPPDMPKGKKKLVYSEVEVPAGMNVEEYREGFIQAVLAYKEAALIGGDVEYSEDDEVTASFDAGVHAGLAFAESEFLQDGKPKAAGAPKHDKKMVDSPDEETDIPGKDTPPAKGPGQPKSGSSKPEKDDSEYQEPTFDPRGPAGSTKKRGSDSLNSSDTGVKQAGKMDIQYEEDDDSAEHKEVFKDLPDGKSESKDSRPGHVGNVKPGRADSKDYKSKTKVKATKTLIHGDDGLDKRPSSKDLGRQNDQSGRGETGEAGEEGKTFRHRGGDTTALEGQGTDEARRVTGSDGGAMAADYKNTGKSKELEEGRKKTGQAPQDEDDRGKAISLGGPKGSGSAVKKPQVRVMYVGKPGVDKPLVTNFSEMEARLQELEAANARLVQEKIAAERAAHRLQLEEFAESLYAHGQLTEATIDQDELVDYMEGLEHGTLEFAEGETAATKLMTILANLPAQVSFSEVAPHNDEEVPFEALDPHEKALRLAADEGLDYAEALKKALFTAE